MSELPYIDFHTHKRVHTGASDVWEIVSMHADVKESENPFTLGFHPWWSHSHLEPNQLDQLRQSLIKERFCLALGECGLDGLKGAGPEIQENNFEAQLSLAEEMGVPVIIHCVRRYDRLLQIRRHWRNQPWVVHGYRRNAILTRQILDAGIKVSVSPFADANASFVEMLRYLPDDAFFLETDSDHRISIRGRYSLMAELRKIDTFALRRQMYQNCCDLFLWKQWPEHGLSAPLY